jgi:hypothetical protein
MQCSDISDRLAAQGEGSSSAYQQRPLVPRPDVSVISIDPETRATVARLEDVSS